MRSLLTKNKLLFFGYLLILILAISVFAGFGKKESHLLISGFHKPFLDYLFKILTWMGDGGFMAFTGIFLLFKRIRYGLTVLCSFLASSLVVQLLKRIVFQDFKRPVAWFHDIGIELHRISGIEYHSAFSFPSGHATTAFALFFGLSFIVKSNVLKLLFLCLAVITAFSRVYLSQHFLGDVIAGSIIGVLIAVIMQLWLESFIQPWMDKSLPGIIRKSLKD